MSAPTAAELFEAEMADAPSRSSSGSVKGPEPSMMDATPGPSGRATAPPRMMESSSTIHQDGPPRGAVSVMVPRVGFGSDTGSREVDVMGVESQRAIDSQAGSRVGESVGEVGAVSVMAPGAPTCVTESERSSDLGASRAQSRHVMMDRSTPQTVTPTGAPTAFSRVHHMWRSREALMRKKKSPGTRSPSPSQMAVRSALRSTATLQSSLREVHEKVHTMQLMLEQERRFADMLRQEVAAGQRKRQPELDAALRRVAKLQEQIERARVRPLLPSGLFRSFLPLR